MHVISRIPKDPGPFFRSRPVVFRKDFFYNDKYKIACGADHTGAAKGGNTIGKEKALSPKRAARKREKEARQLARLEREQAKSKPAGYMAYFMLIISVIYIADEVTSQIGTQMQSVIANQIFAPVVGAEFAVARMSTLGMAALPFTVVAMFIYNPLSDRYGRKIFLVINTLGMGLGTMLISIATNIPVYILGACCISFFIPHDMQAVYIYESTPSQHRAKIYSVVKAVATVGMMIIPLLRSAFIPGTDLTEWRMVYRVPSILAFVVAIAALFLIRESDAFLESRIRQLKMTDEEREAAKEKKQVTGENIGVVEGFKYILSHKQRLWVGIANGFTICGMVITMYYESTMTHGFAQHFVARGMDLETAKLEATAYVSMALMLFPIGSALFQAVQGFFSDAWGRKPTAILMSAVSMISFLIFYIGANRFWNPYLVGFLAGAAVGSYWASGDIVGLIATESTPTTVRASVGAAGPIVMGIIALPVFVIFFVLMNVVGDTMIGPLCLIYSTIGLGVGLLILWIKVKETKGVDLANLKGDEFE